MIFSSSAWKGLAYHWQSQPHSGSSSFQKNIGPSCPIILHVFLWFCGFSNVFCKVGAECSKLDEDVKGRLCFCVESTISTFLQYESHS
jgi:hypothetical protein